MVHALVDLRSYVPKKLALNLKNHTTPSAKPCIEELPILEVKTLLYHLRYAFLE